MKKLTKILVVILSLLAITCFSLACAPSTPDNGGEGQTPSQHTHSYITNFDTLKHWEECSCGEKKDITQHSFTDGKCACGYEQTQTHTHAYPETYTFDSEFHWFECDCGEKKSTAEHTFTDGKCSCGYEKKEEGGQTPSVPDTPTHTHAFDRTTIHDDYLKSKATCENKAVYYYACKCGEKGSKTYEYGNALGHNYGEFVSNGDGTHTKTCANENNHKITENCNGGTATCKEKAVCEDCNTTYGNFSEHTYSDKWTITETHHYKSATCGCDVKRDYAEHTLDDNGWCETCDEVITATSGIIYDKSADGTYAEVIGYAGSAKKIKIAEAYQGLPVKNIYNEAFRDTNITSVIIPDSVESIGYSAFYNCDSLTSVVIPDSVTSIGGNAFRSCDSLTSVEIGESVKDISGYAFYGCSLLTSVIISNSVERIGTAAFYYCYSLTSVEYKGSIDSWVEIEFVNNPLSYAKKLIIDGKEVTEVKLTTATKINDYAFNNYTSLTSVVIGDSVKEIGDFAFYNCNNLQFNEYGNCKYLGSSDNDYFALIEVTNQNLSSYEIHENTKIIAGRALYGCGRISSIEIPDGVTSIGSRAFCNCTSLTSIVIPDSVTSIGDEVFYGCELLTSENITVKDSNGWQYYTSWDDTWHDISSSDVARYIKYTYPLRKN